MSIKCIKQSKPLNLRGGKKEVCTAKLVRNLDITAEDMLNELEWDYKIPPQTTIKVMKAMQEAFVECLLLGSAVEISYIGKFVPSVNVKTSDSEESFDLENILGVKIIYYPHKDIKEGLKKAKFVF